MMLERASWRGDESGGAGAAVESGAPGRRTLVESLPGIAAAAPGRHARTGSDALAAHLGLTLDQPGSSTEREAEDRGAAIARGSEGPGAPAGPRRGLSLAPLHPALARVAGEGEQLPAAVRAPFEDAYGADLSGVRVHTDGRAQALSRGLAAHAFTSGGHVFMQPGRLAPDTEEGRALLGHELGHAVQQEGTRGHVQRATDMAQLSNTPVLPELQFQTVQQPGSVKAAVDQRDLAVGGVARDGNYNNLAKRRFEEALATFIFHRWDLVGPTVLLVSARVLEYFKARERAVNIAVIDSMHQVQEKPETLGGPGFRPQDAEEGAKILLDQIPASLPAHLNVHGKFSYEVYTREAGDFQTGRAAEVFQKLEGTELGGAARDYSTTLMPEALFAVPSVDNRTNPDVGRPRISNARKDEIGLASQLSGLAPAEEHQRLPVAPEIGGRPTNSQQQHTRGGDAFVLDESKRWTQEARLLYDMPVMAGPSGSAALMMNTALVLGLTPEQLQVYSMALVGSIVGGGHHTFHEIMTVGALVGIPYVPGDYLSAIPRALWLDEGFRELVGRFFESTGDFSERSRTDSAEPPLGATQELQFGLPPVRDDADLGSLLQAIAVRLDRPRTELTIAPVNEGGFDTKGVSGSPVFLVKHLGRPLGVIKVFQAFGEMAQELSAMAELGSLQIDKLGAPQLLAAGKLVPGGGNLVKDRELGFMMASIAPGVPLDDLMVAVGKATAERPQRLQELREAVGAVGARLAALHTQPPGSGQGPVGEDFIRLHVEKVTSYANDVAQSQAALQWGLDGFPLDQLAHTVCTDFAKDPGPTAIIHGDAHPGNFFFDSSTGMVTAIDTPTMDTSIGRGDKPLGSPARDVVNFLHKLDTVGRGAQLRAEEVEALQQELAHRYGEAGGKVAPGSARRFFQLRVLLSELRTAVKSGAEADGRRLIGLVRGC